jgi:hypothetical protein
MGSWFDLEKENKPQPGNIPAEVFTQGFLLDLYQQLNGQ